LGSSLSQSKEISPLARGYAICLTATFIWSWSSIFIRYLYLEFNMLPLVLTFWRDLLASAILGIILLIFAKKNLVLDRNNWIFILAYGIFLGFFNSIFSVSVSLNGAAVATVLAYSSGAFTAVMAWHFFKERLDWVKITAVVLSLTGCVLVAGAYNISNWRLNPLGVATGLLTGLGFAIFSLLGRAASKRGINPWATVLFTFGIATIVILMLNIFPISLTEHLGSRHIFMLGNSWVGWLLLFGLAIGPTVGGFGLYTVSLGYLPASVANIINTLEPAFTVLWAYLLLSERFSPLQLSGSLLIMFGVIALRLGREQVDVLVAP
jgi:drug/metabolite transporter (DMT)-like permease